MRRPLAALLLTLGLVGGSAGCAAGKPAEKTAMVCGTEVAGELAAAFGTPARTTPASTWVKPTFTCIYEYANGSFTMTVTELKDEAAAAAYLSDRRGGNELVPELGAGAFHEPNGNVYASREASVLYVDVSRLPEPFGTPPSPRAQAARTIAETVLHCWTEES
ncbi:hypothetical protein [Hamadaea tsunoensis]|uniref:hypothetical protein n=1 Tax=Hamadaea tsunoensis TaxID=53368 RepID=UPI0004275D6F|nr:hypothetical protein [Hamadaea tsunoensis]